MGIYVIRFDEFIQKLDISYFLSIIALIFSAYGPTIRRFPDSVTVGFRPDVYQLISARRAYFI
jgi:hypothetical protein